MNNQRQYNQQQNNGQHNGYRSQYRPYDRSQARKDQLERDLQSLERDLVKIDTQLDALVNKGMLLEQAKAAHLRAVPFAIAQVALSTLGVRYLPPVARTWHFKHQQYLRAEEALRQRAVTLHYQREAIETQIEHTQIMIDMVQYEP